MTNLSYKKLIQSEAFNINFPIKTKCTLWYKYYYCREQMTDKRVSLQVSLVVFSLQVLNPKKKGKKKKKYLNSGTVSQHHIYVYHFSQIGMGVKMTKEKKRKKGASVKKVLV